MLFNLLSNEHFILWPVEQTLTTNCSDRPHWWGGGGEELYTQMGFFLFWPIDIFIVEKCEWYDLKARSA